MDNNWKQSFSEKLDKHHQWPSLYIFKFIVPASKLHEVKSLFPEYVFTERASSKGNYSSITLEMMMPSANSVIEIYERASTIEGLIAL